MKNVFIILSLSFILYSCNKDEDYSDKAEIKSFEVTNVSDINLNLVKTEINSSDQKIFVFFNNDLTDISFPIDLEFNAKLSSGASINSPSNNQISFNNADDVKTIKIKAENGDIKNWHLFVIHKQVLNSDFEDWYLQTGIDGIEYDEIGLSYNKTVWSTANIGTSLYGKYCTQPFSDESNIYPKLVTDSIDPNLPLATGTLFTGEFNYQAAITNPLNPQLATVLGTPFIFKPTSFRIKYSYTAADRFVQVNYKSSTYIFAGNDVEEIEGEDECAMYAVVGIIDGNDIIEIGRAELFSTSTEGVVEQYVDFVYTLSIEPTHIAVVFSSSKEGYMWKGSVGSELIIQEFELLYE